MHKPFTWNHNTYQGKGQTKGGEDEELCKTIHNKENMLSWERERERESLSNIIPDLL